MREIKFRIWESKRKQWIHRPGFEINLLGETIIMGAILGRPDCTYVSLEDLNDLVCLQYTGLKDKNGKEIYEGDVVKCHDHPTGIEDVTGAVSFDCGRYWVGTKSILSLDDYGTAWTEVIGNIYENPELLNK